MQLACNALHAGNRVVWIDTGAPIPGPRFQDILQSYSGVPTGQDPASSPPVSRSLDDLLEKFTYYNIHTLPHLLVLFLHPTAQFPPPDTALMIIDNVSAPFATAFPRSTPSSSSFFSDHANGKTGSSSLDIARKHKLQWAANRKWVVAGDLAAAMNKMAALKKVAVVVINQVATSLKGVKRAVLKPALAGTAWEVAVGNRVVLWRDFAPYSDGSADASGSIARSLPFAEVVKAGGKVRPVGEGDAVPFSIAQVRKKRHDTSPGLNIIQEGLRELRLPSPISPTLETKQQPKPPPTTLPTTTASTDNTTTTTTTKRKADEIADSEDELLVGSDDDFGLPPDDDDLFDDVVVGLS